MRLKHGTGNTSQEYTKSMNQDIAVIAVGMPCLYQRRAELYFHRCARIRNRMTVAVVLL